jgi:hypothetical protein
MSDTPDPNNPKPGYRFVGSYSGDAMTVRYVDDEWVFGTYDSDDTQSTNRRHQFPANYRPAQPVWPEPRDKWGVQYDDGADVSMYDDKSEAQDVVAGCNDARLIRYVPEVVE